MCNAGEHTTDAPRRVGNAHLALCYAPAFALDSGSLLLTTLATAVANADNSHKCHVWSADSTSPEMCGASALTTNALATRTVHKARLRQLDPGIQQGEGDGSAAERARERETQRKIQITQQQRVWWMPALYL